MSYSFDGLEASGVATINKDRNSREGDTRHDKLGEARGKLKQ